RGIRELGQQPGGCRRGGVVGQAARRTVAQQVILLTEQYCHGIEALLLANALELLEEPDTGGSWRVLSQLAGHQLACLYPLRVAARGAQLKADVLPLLLRGLGSQIRQQFVERLRQRLALEVEWRVLLLRPSQVSVSQAQNQRCEQAQHSHDGP